MRPLPLNPCFCAAEHLCAHVVGTGSLVVNLHSWTFCLEKSELPSSDVESSHRLVDIQFTKATRTLTNSSEALSSFLQPKDQEAAHLRHEMGTLVQGSRSCHWCEARITRSKTIKHKFKGSANSPCFRCTSIIL